MHTIAGDKGIFLGSKVPRECAAIPSHVNDPGKDAFKV
jgi:hypothetical protein